ncbi:MAG: hypothetical protein GXP29_03470 [Planctomycetes bacterium]|nr:hypothetical protein [Planctomycetota bacterium]
MMMINNGRSRLCAAAAVLGAAVFGINADIEGAARKVDSASRQVRLSDAGVGRLAPSSVGLPTAGLSLEAWTQRMQQVPPGGYPIFAPQVVDYRNDEPSRLRRAGLLVGAMPLPDGFGMVSTGHTVCAAGNCTFNIDCDDGDPCTTDTCTIPPEGPICQGVCTNPTIADGLEGGCDDGLFCNGIESCQSGSCTSGVAPTCCAGTVDEPAESCSEDLGRCSAESEVAGRRCVEDTDCTGGVCDHCVDLCSVDTDCDDGFACNGAETCNAGVCQAGPPACGSGANCFEKRCIGAILVTACTNADDCAGNQTCGNKFCDTFGGGPCQDDTDCGAGVSCIPANPCQRVSFGSLLSSGRIG